MLAEQATKGIYLDVPEKDWSLFSELIRKFGWRKSTLSDTQNESSNPQFVIPKTFTCSLLQKQSMLHILFLGIRIWRSDAVLCKRSLQAGRRGEWGIHCWRNSSGRYQVGCCRRWPRSQRCWWRGFCIHNGKSLRHTIMCHCEGRSPEGNLETEKALRKGGAFLISVLSIIQSRYK